MITARITKGADLDKRFRHAVPGMDSAVHQTVMRLALKMTSLVKRKLSGEVLKVRTGRLRRSIHPEWEFRRGWSGATVGTNVEYAAIHEFGGDIVPKRAPALLFKVDGRWVRTQRVRMPERSFLRSALREMEPEIEGQLRAAVMQEIGKAKR